MEMIIGPVYKLGVLEFLSSVYVRAGAFSGEISSVERTKPIYTTSQLVVYKTKLYLKQ